MGWRCLQGSRCGMMSCLGTSCAASAARFGQCAAAAALPGTHFRPPASRLPPASCMSEITFTAGRAVRDAPGPWRPPKIAAFLQKPTSMNLAVEARTGGCTLKHHSYLHIVHCHGLPSRCCRSSICRLVRIGHHPLPTVFAFARGIILELLKQASDRFNDATLKFRERGWG